MHWSCSDVDSCENFECKLNLCISVKNPNLGAGREVDEYAVWLRVYPKPLQHAEARHLLPLLSAAAHMSNVVLRRDCGTVVPHSTVLLTFGRHRCYDLDSQRRHILHDLV